MDWDIKGRTCLVTGANQGIGFYTALGLAKRGAVVVMHARDAVRGQAAVEAVQAESGNDAVSLLLADFASFKSVKAAVQEFLQRHDALHVLVNNAGAIFGKRAVTPDGYEMTIQVNHLSPFLLTGLLLPLIKKSAPSRIINVSSMAHYGAGINFEDFMSVKNYNEFVAYARSKLANMLFTHRLAKTLEGAGVTVNALHPGVVRSGFSGSGSGLAKFFYNTFGFMLDTPEKGARTSIYAAVSAEAGLVTGRYFSDCMEKRPSKGARDDRAAEKLWGLSLKLTGIQEL